MSNQDDNNGGCFAIAFVIAIGLIMGMLNKCTGGKSNKIDGTRGRRAEVIYSSPAPLTSCCYYLKTDLGL